LTVHTWTGISALQLGVPATLVAEAVFARALSALKDERVAAAQLLGPARQLEGAALPSVDDVRDALYASKIVSYAQGFSLLQAAGAEYGWPLDLGRIAGLWRAGCIIRSVFLDRITEAFARDPVLPSLLVDPFFREELGAAEPGWRRTVAAAVSLGIPAPAYASALGFLDAYRSERLPANLIQAQRDAFGAHTYERLDRARGEFFHTNWTGRGGTTASTTYNA
jgi:6-phosphogluconate dehydrogenase